MTKNILNSLFMMSNNKINSGVRALLVLLLFALCAGNAWGFTSTPKFKARATTGTPNGAGQVYGYRGGGDGRSPYDELLTNIPNWYDVTDAATVTLVDDITVKQEEDMSSSNHPDGYSKMDGTTDNASQTQSVYVLHMYFYAKANPGYQFDGWFSDASGEENKRLDGSTLHYPLPGVNPYGGHYTKETVAKKKTNSQAGEVKTYSGQRWNNQGKDPNAPGTGWYNNNAFNYLRYAHFIDKNTANKPVTVYAKFSVIPRHVVFAGTGFNGVTYTAGGTTVGKSNVESGNITGNIALAITSCDPAKYKFVKWQYSVGPNGAPTDIATTADATYVFDATLGYPVATPNASGGYDYAGYEKVYIWPIFQEIVDAEATVQIGADTVPYKHWADAFAAAKAENVSGAIVTLKKDIAGITTVQTVDRNMTLDLNGHTITGSVNNMFTVSAGNFTLCDNTPAAAGKIVLEISEATTYAVTVNSGAKLTMQSGGVSATNTLETGTSRGVEIKNGGTLEMTGGNIYAESAKNAYALINRGMATIGGGNIQARAKGTSTKGTGVTAVAFLNTNTNGSGIATINGGTCSAVADSTTAYGIQQYVNTVTINNAVVTATAGKSGDVALYRSGGKILVKGGKYKARSVLNTANKSYIELQGGIYSTWTNVRQSCTTGYDCYEMLPGADWNDGYRFEVIAATDHPRVCKVLTIASTTYYESLADALAYANNNSGTTMSIIMMAFEHTLPAGNYTLPPRADLVVPYSVDQTGVNASAPPRPATSGVTTPTAFRKLTLVEGVRLDVFGKVEIGGMQGYSNGGVQEGVPHGPYGWLVMNEGSEMILENGATLTAWGFATGAGEIDVRRGAIVHEQFQIADWEGGSYASTLLGSVFPISQYYIQNIECPAKYHPGSSLVTSACVYVPRVTFLAATDNVKVIGVDGEQALFLMDNNDESEDTWVRKSYDAAKDRQVYEINSSARLGSIRIQFPDVLLIGSLDINSASFNLPLTNNMRIHLLEGTMGITQDMIMLPGTEIEIDKEATVSINAGKSIYFYDDAEWGKYVYSGVYARRVNYRPIKTPTATERDIASNTALGDAKLFVHGTFDVKGKIYTTTTGANIYSTNKDAGTIYFSSAAPSANSTIKMYSGTETTVHDEIMVPALLRNADNSTTNTSGTTAGKSFAYKDGRWECWTQDGCFFVDNTDTYYAKPADYVALLNGKTENADHTYSSADETRTFILVEGCQWWEVELEDEAAGLWHCTHPLNDVYYYHNGTSWVVKKQTVTWKNYDGSVVATYTNVPYKTTPVFNSTTPTRPMDAYYTYDFTGWSPELGPVTSDMTFTAQYTPKDRMYTIVFKNENGSVIETNYCTMGQVPVCSKKPAKAGYTLVWSPTIEAVTGDAEYQATFTNEVASHYTVTFKNYNNTEVLQSGEVTTGTMPVYSGATPQKPGTLDQIFVWEGQWEPALHNVDANVVYTPVFHAYAKYTITYNAGEHGTGAEQTAQKTQGTPITLLGATFTRTGYTQSGWSTTDGGAKTYDLGASYTADANVTLYPVWTISSYTIVWKNADGTVLETDENVPYGATPEYNGATPVKTGEEQAYSFVGWTPEVTTVNGDAEYTATYTLREYTITWKNADNALLATTMSHWGDTPEYPNPTPTYTDNEHRIYRFVGWTPEVHAVNSDVNVYTAKYERVDNLDVPGEHTVSIETTITTTKVHVNGHLVVTSNLTTTDLILEGTLNTSGQIENNGTVTATNVYYDLSNGEEGFKARTWYAIAVPWQVDVPKYNQAGCGVYLTNDGENFTQQNLGASFDLLYYDGAYRAQNGPSSKCWKLVEKDAAANHIIFPGRAYMIYLTSDAKTIRFKKKAGAALFTDQTHVQPYSGNGNAKDANWNGIANPATFHAYLNTASSNQGQVYIAGADRYDPIANMSTYPLVVGQPIFVQATTDKDVMAYATNEDYASHAPRRMSSSEEEKIMAEVRIAPEGKTYTDRLYVGVEEFKADEYEIGKDLAKAGISTKVAQMWVNRYNTELCINSMALVNNRAEYPLTISAPAAGEYTIGIEPSAMAENQTYVLYLTLNGQPIWNLNYNAYTATLEKGTTEGYGLRLVYNAPEIATGIEETTIENGEQIRKVMIDEKVYIIRGGQVYSIDGQLVKY